MVEGVVSYELKHEKGWEQPQYDNTNRLSKFQQLLSVIKFTKKKNKNFEIKKIENCFDQNR